MEKSERAKREEEILNFWREREIFSKTLAKESPKGEFVFYEGPPTANGRPAIHHLEARAFKDVLPRYKTMQGFHVRRKAGWDTHGLPVELEVERELGLKSKKEIEEYGIAKFNQKCKESVWKYLTEWRNFTDRIAFWVDQENPYVTYYPEYIESLWWIVGQVAERGLLYKDYKVLPWCPRCGTALSSHELAQGYKDVKDLSVYVKFEIKDNAPRLRSGQAKTYVLAWTTTPWTLPGNVALAVGEDIEYVKIKIGEEFLILAKDRLSVISGEYEVVAEMKGKDLVGLEYEPLYDYLGASLPSGSESSKLVNAFKIYPAKFVTTTDGTGVVHTAVMYGADDFELGTKVGLPKHHLVNDDGTFKKEAGFLAGRFVKDEAVAVDIIKDLAHRGLLYKKEKYEHSYPHCWRCKTPLIYFARDSWYIRMSSLRDELVRENKNINWEPEHIKEGRFGEWLREIKDWAISRERYWGTPLPIWQNAEGDRIVVDGVETLKKYTKKSGNKYFVMRHGEAENNILGIINSNPKDIYHLTEKGRKQVLESAQKLKEEKIDMIFSSPFTRVRESVEITAETIGFDKSKIIIDERIHEVNAGEFNQKSVRDYHLFYSSREECFVKRPEGGESYTDIKRRVGNFIYEIEKEHQGKNILIVTHDLPSWMMFSAAEGATPAECLHRRKDSEFFLDNAEVRELDFAPIPHNEDYELDLHRPYVDEVVLHKDGKEYRRVKEVMDVWFDSGAMPFAQDHYPFAGEKLLYPADFISEAIDQTRGWFYTLLAVGVLLGRGAPYKNVICLGHLLDKEGKKMSKSVGNVINPWEMMDKYGADALRYWMYSVNQPGESKNFDEKTVVEYDRQLFGLLYNVLSFYELYRDKDLEQGEFEEKPSNVLDQWILARQDALLELVTKNLDDYNILEPARAIKDFVGDLSTWYLRRSRERIKGGDAEAKRTLYFVLKQLAKIMAPFTPFAAEDIWQKLRVPQNKESIHLTNWPASAKASAGEALLNNMQLVRDICTAGNAERKKINIPVRQPLQKLVARSQPLDAEFFDLIKEELNVKEVVFEEKMEKEIDLDSTITPELKEEGNYRELLRVVQDLRKKENLAPSDQIILIIETEESGKKLIEKFETELKKSAGISKLEFSANDSAEIKIDNLNFKIKIQK